MYHTNVQRVFCEAVLLLGVCWSAVFVRAGESQWSSWYNSDSPVFGSGDDETVERISVVFGLPCPAQDIHAVQCRRRGGGNAGGEGTFDHRTVYGGDVLHVPCNTSGLLCRHEDQAPLFQSSASYSSVRRCADYEIRLRCYYGRDNNNNQTKPPATDTITSHGAFVALVAGGSVVVPLVVVLVVRLRKAKRARQQGSQENGGQDSAQTPPREGDGTPGEVVDAPPPYDLLFANTTPESVVAEGPEQAVVDRRSSTYRLVADGHVTRTGHVRQGAVNHAVDIGNPDALSTVTGTGTSGESSTQIPVSSSSGGPSSQSRTSHGTSTVSPSLAAVLSSDNRLRRVSSQSSASSTRALLTSTQSENDVTHRDPPPAYDWPGHAIPSHVTVVMPTARDDDDDTASDTAPSDTSSEESSQNSSPPRSSSSSPSQRQSSSARSPPRRFLGMHLSILDIMSAIYPDPNLTPTPPPTYDDALKILAAPVQPEVQVT